MTFGSPSLPASPAFSVSPGLKAKSPHSMSCTPTPSRCSRLAELLEGGTPTWPAARGALASSTRSLSSPDIRVPLKLAPLPPSTPVSAHKSPDGSGSTSKTRSKSPGDSLKERLPTSSSNEDEESWAAATLLSLSPKPEIEIPPSTTNIDVEQGDFMRSLEPVVVDRENSAAGTRRESNAWRSVDPVDAFSTLDGGPTVEEALARLTFGSEGLGEAELVRMNVSFCRHKEADSSEVEKVDLHRILTHLGYLFVKQDRVEKLAKKVTDFTTFDFQEFEHLVMDWCTLEHAEIRKVYDSFDESKNDQVPASSMAKMLRCLDIVAVRSVLRDVFEMAKLDERGYLSVNEFFRFLATYRAVEGFSRAQIAAARKVFEDEVASSSSHGGNALKAKKRVLANALLKAYGEHIATQLAELLDNVHWDGCKNVGISFHEFMVWGRILRDMQMKKLHTLFSDADQDPDGRISVTELVRLMRPAGFTLFSTAVDEILVEMNTTRNSKLDFSDYVRFLKACQKRAGFTRFELEELASTFRRFDYDRNDGIDHLELLDLLRYLGYSTHLKDVHQFVSQVDFNGNGSMDFGEFLYTMRLHREDELAKMIKIYDESKDARSRELPAAKLKDTLQKLGYLPRAEVLEMLLNEVGNPEQFCFEKFMSVVDHFRRMSTTEKRKRAGFSDKEFNLICKLFEKHNVHRKQELEKGELILLLIDAGIFMNTADARNEIFEMLDKARESAAKAGIEEEQLGRPSSPRCRFWPLVHLLRAVFHKDDCGVLRREDQAVDETRFEPSEVQEFRTIFLECSRWGPHASHTPTDNEEEQVGSPAAMRSRRSSLPAVSMTSTGNAMAMAASLRSQPLNRTQPISIPGKLATPAASPMPAGHQNLSLKECLGGNPSASMASAKDVEVVVFKRRMKMRISMEQRKELEQQVHQITGNNKDNMMDFADFLRLMKWMLQTNFSKINEVAEKIADNERTRMAESGSQAPPTPINVTNAVSTAMEKTLCMKSPSQRQRRKSM